MSLFVDSRLSCVGRCLVPVVYGLLTNMRRWLVLCCALFDGWCALFVVVCGLVVVVCRLFGVVCCVFVVACLCLIIGCRLLRAVC